MPTPNIFDQLAGAFFREGTKMRKLDAKGSGDPDTTSRCASEDDEFEKRLVEMFSRLDTNGDRLLDKDEVREAFRQLGIPSHSIKAFMEEADANRSGTIDFEELRAHAVRRRQNIREVFDELRGDETRLTSARLIAGLEKLNIKATDEVFV